MSEEKVEEMEIADLLVGFLKISKLSEAIRALIFIKLVKEDQMLKMCRYLHDNPEATDEEALDKAIALGAEF